MPTTKYIKQPLSNSNLASYSDAEFRKIELSIASLLSAITELDNMIVERGSFVVTLTGLTTTVTGTALYIKLDNLVFLSLPSLSGTSNANTCTMTGLPDGLKPSTNQGLNYAVIDDNGVSQDGLVRMLNTGVIQFWKGLSATGWTAAGVKANNQVNMFYFL